MIKKINSIVILLFVLISFGTHAQISVPFPSPKGSVSAVVGLTDVQIEYYRPKVNGRKIFGAGEEYLVKYGQIWRTGANSGSKITFSTDVKVGGKAVPAGTYLIFTIPGEKSWDFMLYSDISLGGNVGKYDKAKEVVKVSINPIKDQNNKQTMTFNISDIDKGNTKANIELAWENTSIKVPLAVSFDGIVMKEIAQKTKVNANNYKVAASYYLENGKDLNQALKWIDLYLNEESNSDHFWVLFVKARILADLGKKKEAIIASKKSMGLAKKRKETSGSDFGYIKRNQDLLDSLK